VSLSAANLPLKTYLHFAKKSWVKNLSFELLRTGAKKEWSGYKHFFRLFMIPGMAHCSGGIGPDQHDPMTAIINWVEKAKTPESMLAKRIEKKEVARTRPLCPYPQVARYKDQGSIDDVANFRCVTP
jgi:hypothetical protein